jgi:hypothetical protein
MAYFKGGGPPLAARFMRHLPDFLVARSLFEKVALAFSSVSRLVPTFLPACLPPAFFWPAVIAASNGHPTLRREALILLGRLVPLISFESVGATRALSPEIDDHVATFEEAHGVSFAADFARALAVTLTKGLAEIDTRPDALCVVRACLAACPRAAAVHYALLLIGYGHDDCQWIPAAVGSECATLAEFVFAGFTERSLQEAAHIVAQLAHLWGDRHCTRRMDLIGDCLLEGCARFPREFARVKRPVIERAWQLLEVEAVPVVVAQVIASFFTLPGVRGASLPPKKKIDDMTVSLCLTGVAKGVASLLLTDT